MICRGLWSDPESRDLKRLVDFRFGLGELRIHAETEGTRRLQAGTEEALLLQVVKDRPRRLQSVTEGASSRDGGGGSSAALDWQDTLLLRFIK